MLGQRFFLISQRTLTRMLRKICIGESDTTHGNEGKKRVNTKKESAAVWMQRYILISLGIKCQILVKYIYPHGKRKRTLIHTRYCEDMLRQGIEQEEVAGLSLFYKIWTENFSHVIIPEVWYGYYM